MNSFLAINVEYIITTLVDAIKILIISNHFLIKAWNLRVKDFSTVVGFKYLIFWYFYFVLDYAQVYIIIYYITIYIIDNDDIIHKITSFFRECLK